jgi:ABC-type glycerol-3-phosphate transport system substrate-binding protein
MKSLKMIMFAVLITGIAAVNIFAGGGAQPNSQSGASGPLTGEIRFSWWGNEARNEATINAISDYESKHAGVKIVPEYSTIDGFYNKLMAQIAAGNPTDVFSNNAEWMTPINEVKGMLDLTDLIDVSSHNPMVNQACSINGRLYGVGVSLNANVIYYNKTQAKELGITVPTGPYTWADLIKICQEVYTKSGGTTYGMVDLRMINGLETWLPAFNKTHDGKEAPFPWTDTDVIITGSDVASFMDFFNKVPKGVLMPPDEVATLSSHVDVPIARRKSFFAFEYSGSFAMYQSQTKDELEMIEYPHDGKGKGNAVSARPGIILSVYSNSKNKAVAVDFIKYFANDPAAGLILKTVRGVLPSTTQREAVLANPAALSDIDKKIFAITDQVYKKTVDPFYAPPPGISTLFGDNYLKKIGQDVAFGRISPQEAGRQFEEMKKEVLTY